MKIDFGQYRREVCEKCDKRATYVFVAGKCSATTTDIYLCAKAKGGNP